MSGDQVVLALIRALEGNLPPNGSITVDMLSELFKLPKERLEQSIVDELNKIGEIDDDSIEAQMLKDKSISVSKLADDVISTCRNLFNPHDVIFSTDAIAKITISGLDADLYSFNFEPLKVSTSSDTRLNVTEVADNHYSINTKSITDGIITLTFSGYLDYEHFMVVEGDALPHYFKPYGTDDYINDNLLKSVYDRIEYSSQVLSPPRAYGENVLYLQPNRVYNINLGEYKDFRLPDVPENSYAQILVQATVNNEDSVTWGTEYFFGGETPHILPGRYNFIWEHDNGVWYAGAILKEEGVSA
jgi:hypothetical protein